MDCLLMTTELLRAMPNATNSRFSLLSRRTPDRGNEDFSKKSIEKIACTLRTR
jgi:hypothetical protein